MIDTSKFYRYLLISISFILLMFTLTNLFTSLDYLTHYSDINHGRKELLNIENTRYQMSARVLPSDY